MRIRKFEKDGFTVIVKHVIDKSPDLNEEWYMLGVCVEIRKQTSTNWANGGLEVGRSSLWGIESDSDEGYIESVEEDLIAEAFSEVEKLKRTDGGTTNMAESTIAHECIARGEYERTRGLIAFNVKPKYTRYTRNQYATVYTFADNSQFVVYDFHGKAYRGTDGNMYARRIDD